MWNDRWCSMRNPHPEQGTDNATWLGLAGQDAQGPYDDGLHRRLLLSEDNGQSFCWEGAWRAGAGNYIEYGGTLDYDCADGDFDPLEQATEFAPCFDGDPYEVLPEVGTVHDIEGVSADQFVAITLTSCLDTDGGDNGECLAYGGGGVYLGEYTGATVSGLDVVEVDASPLATSTCSTLDRFHANAQPELEPHPDSQWTSSGYARFFLKFKDYADSTTGVSCTGGVWELSFDTLDPALFTVWRQVDLALSSGYGNPRDRTNNVLGLAMAPDGRWLLVYGATEYEYPVGTQTAWRATSWLNAYDLDSGGITWPPAGPGTLVPAKTAVWTADVLSASPSPADFTGSLPFIVRTVRPHPHVDNTWFFGGYASSECPTCADGGAWELQRRYRLTTHAWNWAWRRLTGNEFEGGRVVQMDWGNDPANALGTEMSALYIQSHGTGPVEAQLSW